MELELWEASDPVSWDDSVSVLETGFFSHGSAWLSLLAETFGAELLRFRLVEGDRLVGLFPAFLMKKGPFRLLASPPAGSETEFLGPAAGAAFDAAAFLEALDRWSETHAVHQVEIGNPCLEGELRGRPDWEMLEWKARVVPLSPDPRIMWTGISGKGRNRLTKARKSGLTVEDTDDPGFPDEHFRQLVEVYAGQGLKPPFPREFYRRMFRRMKAAGALYAVRVRDEGVCLASGLFPHDRRTVYSVSTASYRAGRALCPNEYLHWGVMEMAGAAGLVRYNLGDNYRTPGSGGRFKDKFGGEIVSVRRFVKSYSPAAKWARTAYRAAARGRSIVRAAMSRFLPERTGR
jgi:hypothetical protein